jgi:hypothetical protein
MSVTAAAGAQDGQQRKDIDAIYHCEIAKPSDEPLGRHGRQTHL